MGPAAQPEESRLMIAIVPRPVAAGVGLGKEHEQNLGAPRPETGGLKVLSLRKLSRRHFSGVKEELSGIMPVK